MKGKSAVGRTKTTSRIMSANTSTSITPPKGLNTNIRRIENGFIISIEQQQSRSGPYKPPRERFVKTLPKGVK